MKNRKNYVWVLVGMIVVLGGLLLASSKAVPESFLYSTRLNVYENMMAKLKTDDYQKASYYISLGEARLSELEALKGQKKLDSAIANNVRNSFNNDTIMVQNLIISLGQKEGNNSQKVLQLSEDLDVQIERAKAIYNIDQLEVLPEDAPVPKATSTTPTTKSTTTKKVK
jgi:hypothetical protein